MRLLRFDFRDDLASVDLHPLVTVVRGLEPHHQRQLFEAIRKLSCGSTMGLRGLVEHQGLLVELDAGTGDPLGSVTTTAPVLIYVDGEAIECDELGLRAEIEQWERRAAIDAVAVEEIRSDLDLSIKARADALRRRSDPEAGIEAVDGASPHELLVATIRRAHELASGIEPQIADCDPALAALVDRWDHHVARREGARLHLAALDAEVSRAEADVDHRLHELDQARRSARPPMLTAEQESRLEELCEASNGTGTSSVLSKWMRSRSPDEDAERQALFDLVGVSSWTEYSVFRLSPTVDPEKLAAVEAAETALAHARAALDDARHRQSSDGLAVGLQDELEQLKADCAPFLGVLVPADIGAALRRQIDVVDNPDWITAMNHLRDALSSNGIHPPYGLAASDVLGWTDSWLRAQDSLHRAGEPPLGAAPAALPDAVPPVPAGAPHPADPGEPWVGDGTAGAPPATVWATPTDDRDHDPHTDPHTEVPDVDGVSAAEDVADPFAVTGADAEDVADPFATVGADAEEAADPFAVTGADAEAAADPFAIAGADAEEAADPFAVTGADAEDTADGDAWEADVIHAAAGDAADPFGVAGADAEDPAGGDAWEAGATHAAAEDAAEDEAEDEDEGADVGTEGAGVDVPTEDEDRHATDDVDEGHDGGDRHPASGPDAADDDADEAAVGVGAVAVPAPGSGTGGSELAAIDDPAQQAAVLDKLLARHNRAMSQIDKAERRAVRSSMRVRELKQQLRARTAGPQVATAAAVLAMVAPVAERVLAEVGGSLPIAVVGDMAELPDGEVAAMMNALEEVAEQVQVVLLTRHPAVAAWAERAGLERASIADGIRALR